MTEAKETKNETITLNKTQYEGLLERLGNLEKGQRQERPKLVTERTAKLRFYGDKPVIWYGNVREIKDKDTGKLVGWMDIKTIDDKTYKVEYLKFLNENVSVVVQIVNQVAEKVVEEFGTRLAVNPNPLFDKKWQEFETDDEIISYKYTAEVKVLDGPHAGETYTLSTMALNA